MNEQFTFTDLLEEMEEAERAKLDAHRTKVQAWFEALSTAQKDQLGQWMQGSSEWLTCQALSAAANDWRTSTRTGRPDAGSTIVGSS